MTLKDIAKQLTTAVQTVPNLVQILRDGLEQATAGSAVEVTQVVSSGTKIASVKVDDETTDLYAPSAAHDYSSTPVIIGKWTDGTTDIYEVVVTTTTNTTGGEELIDISSLNVDRVYEMTATAENNGGSVMLNYFASSSDMCVVYLANNNEKISLTHFGAWSMDIPVTIILRYAVKAE